ncbi:MAG: HD domain-containing phosphohydrolase [Gallionella sp.]
MINVAEIAENQLHDPVYLKSVTELGDDRQLVTTRDVCSSTGIKLVSGGMQFNSSLYSKLLQHKLSPPLDQCLAIEDSVTNASLVAELPAFLTQDGWLQSMQSAMPDCGIFEEVLAKVPIHPTIAFKLTVMREKHPALFRHSIYLTLICIYAGVRHGLDSGKLAQLATAALLHDIGILHIDPALLEHDHILSDPERHHLYAHPLTAWIIMKECHGYSQEVLDAVLQHHERLDGSGYPRGLEDDAIGLYGRILAIGEIIASRHGDENSALGKMRLEAILKLNSRRYGRKFIGYFDVFYRSDAEAPPCIKASKQDILDQLHCALSAISGWERLWDKYYQGYRAFNGINNRIQNLKIEMLDAGLTPLGIEESMRGIEDSARTCSEMHVLLGEVIWQLHGVLEEIKRRWPNIDKESPESCATHILGWMGETERAMKQNRLINPHSSAHNG